jgi:hypothetical protein
MLKTLISCGEIVSKIGRFVKKIEEMPLYI